MFRYPTPFREKACERMIAGEPVTELAEELGVSIATLHRWRRRRSLTSGVSPV